MARPRLGERKPEPVYCLNLAKYSIADFRCACSIGHSGLFSDFRCDCIRNQRQIGRREAAMRTKPPFSVAAIANAAFPRTCSRFYAAMQPKPRERPFSNTDVGGFQTGPLLHLARTKRGPTSDMTCPLENWSIYNLGFFDQLVAACN